MSALMSNWDIAESALQTSLTADGSAQRELSNYQKGIEYSIGQMQAQWQEFANTVIDSDIFKGVVDGATTLLGVLTKIAGLGNGAGLLGILAGGIGIAQFIKNLD